MTIFIGKITRRRSYPRVLSNNLPGNIKEIDGEFYIDGKKLETETVSFEEFFGISPEEDSRQDS